jgi:segregation and condensation protein B
MQENEHNSEPLSLTALIEALLFVSPDPLTPTQLAKVLDVPARTLESELEKLEKQYLGRGIRLQRFQGKVQLVSAPQAGPYVETLLGLENSSRLSQAALETLAIIVYQQPITRPQIEAIRGVSCDGVLKTLLGRGLIEEVGRAETPGRPMLYGVTQEFLQHFGYTSLDELPSLEEMTLLNDNLSQASEMQRKEEYG